MKTKLIGLFFILICTYGYSQTTTTDCKCCSETYRQFDFWIGDWEVFDTLNNKLVENKIISLQDSCLLQENWTSKNITGTSYNYYNSIDSSWNQVWVDNIGTHLVLKGHYSENKMVLQSDKIKAVKIPYYINRLVWVKNVNGTVTQTWEIIDDQENILSLVFKGIYKKKSKQNKISK